MSEPSAPAGPLLPTVSIVEQSMRQARRAVAITLAGAALFTAVLVALIATFVWSTTGPLISYLSKTYALPSLVLAFWRDLFVSLGMAAGLLVFSRARFQLDRSHWKFMVFYGFTLALFNSMWTFSVQYNGAAVATVLAFSSPAMTAILSKLIFKERFNQVKILSIYH